MASCSLANLGNCIIERFFEFALSLLNFSIKPILNLVLNLLSEPINLSLFFSFWVIIVYVLSMFYALLLLGTGLNFMISGYDPEKRESAKTWLRNIVMMVILVQSSFFIYQLAIDLSAIMTSTTLGLIDPSFFSLSAEGIADLGSSILLSFLYIATLIVTVLVLLIRYAVVSVGVVLFPIAILFYFVPPLQQYGSLILNFLETLQL